MHTTRTTFLPTGSVSHSQTSQTVWRYGSHNAPSSVLAHTDRRRDCVCFQLPLADDHFIIITTLTTVIAVVAAVVVVVNTVLTKRRCADVSRTIFIFEMELNNVQFAGVWHGIAVSDRCVA